MHIKQITISGFKSYRDATIAGPFSPGHNVVVGRNGSGKSNFFDAVRFVLSDTFSSLRAEERVALLHEGAGASVLSAYVEMLFDNSDGRLPSERDEVSLRRMIGLKKDEYILDRKNVSRSEVFNLLESAGFSRSNPYYIVQQGKVAALCGMSDRQRLDLLKEVAGTRVYDEHRKESLKTMEETDQRREKISEVVSFIESRLAELESEKEELKAFQRLDKERKAVQYTIHVLELEQAKNTLEQLDNQHIEQRSKGEELNSRLVELRANLADGENALKKLTPDLRHLQGMRDKHDSSRKALIERVAKLRVDVSDVTQAAEQARETVQTSRAELTDVRQQISDKVDALRPLDSKLNELKQKESEVSGQMQEMERELLRLRVKDSRSNQFTSVAQRDTHLKRNIREERKRLAAFRAQIVSAQKESERLQKTVERNETKLQEQRQTLETTRNTMSDSDGVEELRNKRDEMHNRRNDIWRRIGEINDKLRDMNSHVSRLEASKRSALGAGAYQAIQAVMRFSEEDPERLGRNRVFGPLVDLIDVDSKFIAAADVTGGGVLSHVVVDSDSTAARLVSLMQTRRAGRVTFIPLNRLENDLPTPPEASPDAIPLVSKIRTDPRFMPAVLQVFNRTLVTRTVSVATELAGRYGVDCVTLEGDQVSKRGAMTGGFMDTSRSRIRSSQHLREAKRDYTEARADLDRLKQEEAGMHGQMSEIMGELQRREGINRSTSAQISRLMDDIGHLERYIQSDKANIPRAEERIRDAEQSVAASERSITDMESELGSALVSGVSREEQSRMEELKRDIDRLKSRLAEDAPRRVSVEKKVVALRSELQNNLRRREVELKRIIESVGGGDGDTGDGSGDAERLALEKVGKQKELLKKAETELESTKVQLADCEKSLGDKMKEYNGLKSRLEQDRDEEARVNKILEDEKQTMEKRYTERAVETQKKERAEKMIRELGSLPSDFDKYRGQTVNSLMKKLKRTNENLSQYSHVNKKALEQFVNFSEQRDSLCRRREDLNSGSESIRSLIDVLDQRKDEDILRTFKGVSKFFSEVFAELVPGGRASLVMLKSSNSTGNGTANGRGRRSSRGEARGRGRSGRTRRSGEGREGTDEEEEGAEHDLEDEEENEGETRVTRLQYSGVAMKVAFSSTGEAYLLQQLSGGQKSIVALALIFAIQRLDPAPFYLFDEIDANLDASHRQAVANVIRKQANHGTQFVTTTFRPEFVNAGDMWYGVTHKKKVSAIQEVDLDVALTFISDEPEERRRKRG